MITQKYIRDKRSPRPKNATISKVMSANKSKNTKPELILRKALCFERLRGYRLNYKKVIGRPDIVFTRKKLAVFVNGCFWHRCPNCNLPLPKTNKKFWLTKFLRNISRDKRKITQLEDLGWKTLTIWECEIKKDINQIVLAVKKELL